MSKLAEDGRCASKWSIRTFGQQAERAVYRGDALDHRGARNADLALLESGNRQTGKGFEQFAGPQQEIGVVRPPQPFVAGGKGLVDQDALRGERLADRREQRAIEVIGYNDRVIAAAQRPRAARLQIDLPYDAMWPGERQQRLAIAVASRHPKAHIEQQPGMAPAARRKV